LEPGFGSPGVILPAHEPRSRAFWRRASYDILVETVRSGSNDEHLSGLRAEGARLEFREAIDVLMLSLRAASSNRY
jgi:hypothetical protein